MGRQWRGTYDLHFNHSTLKDLERSKHMGCCICRIIWDEITQKDHGDKFGTWLQKHLRAGTYESLAQSGHEVKAVRALLTEVQIKQSLQTYRLDFRLQAFGGSKRIATFLLQQSGEFSLTY
jgi:hypothetical protein